MPGFAKEIFLELDLDEKHLCCVCSLVFRDAVQSQCGHRYCDSCFKENLQIESKPRCPACPPQSQEGVLVPTEIYPDFVVRKQLRQTRVRCINDGCTWQGSLQAYSTDHEESCPFTRIKCLKSGCGKTIRRSYLSHHLEKECPMRLVECRHCKAKYPFKESKKHISECSESPTMCGSCNKRVPRSQIERHMDPNLGDCPKRKINCMFFPIGCTVKVVASSMEEHCNKNITEHNVLMVKALNPDAHGGVQLGYDKSQALAVSNQEVHLGKGDPPKTNIQELCDSMKNVQGRMEKADVIMATLDKRSETFEKVLAMLSNQLETMNSKVSPLEKQNAYLKDVVEKQSLQLAEQDQTITLKSVKLAEQELRLQAVEAATFDGVLLWRISDIRRRKQDAVSGRTTSFYSPVFYTSRHGYKLSVRIYLNGDGMGKGTNMSLFFVVMRGRYDALLKWPFQQKVTFMLLDQGLQGNNVMDAFRPDPTSSSFKRPTTDMNVASGCPLFVPQPLLSDTNSYIRDDVMFIKVIVDTAGLESI